LIIVLHGGPGLTHDYLRPEWDRLASIGEVVYYDQRGCGENPTAGPLTWQTHVADIDRLIRVLRHGRPVVLAGSSWGAELALRYAYLHPGSADALVLSGYGGWYNVPVRGDTIGLGANIEAGIQRVIREDGAVTLRQPADPKTGKRRVYALSPSSVGGDSAFAWRFPMNCHENGRRTSLSRLGPPVSALKSVRTPTLAISGGQGFIPDASIQLVGILPNLEIDSIPGGGHDPWYTQTDAFFEIVSRFLHERLRSEE
jgi:pimeloyl-ACP methyl ester carboxylesterase